MLELAKGVVSNEARAKIQGSIKFSSGEDCQAPLQSFIVTQGACQNVVVGNSVTGFKLTNSKSTKRSFYFYDLPDCLGDVGDFLSLPADFPCQTITDASNYQDFPAASFKLKCR